MRKNMKKLTVATVIGAMTVTALAPVSAQAKDKTLTVRHFLIWSITFLKEYVLYGHYLRTSN